MSFPVVVKLHNFWIYQMKLQKLCVSNYLLYLKLIEKLIIIKLCL